jgi:hypothetical protein
MKTVKAIFGLVVLFGAIYIGWTMIPPYFNNYKLEDVIADEARINTYSNKSEDAMRETVFQKAKDLDIPLTRENIAVTRSGQSISIDVNYTVHLDYPIHPVDLHFQTSSKNRAY